ncbi:MAG TPA: outer membrane beta-barrel protein [Polyangiales bacterium]|nr:outer membrane beta-barrel protein [Polyangiales bacterium]
MPAEPIAEPAPAEPAAAPAAVEPAAPPPAAAEETPAGPDPVFKDWGAPGTATQAEVPPRIEAAILLGVGASFDDTVGSVNPLGFGFGLRGNYRLLPELAVGGRFVYYVGGSSELPTGEVSMSSWVFAADAAYVLPISGMLLEPGIALGLTGRSIDGRAAFVTTDTGFIAGSAEDTQVSFYVAPGASLCVPMSLVAEGLDQLFFGADVRLVMAFGHGVSGAIELMAQGGLRF